MNRFVNFPGYDHRQSLRCIKVYEPERCPATYIMQKSKRKVQGVPQSQTAALPRHQEEEETDKSKQAQIDQHTKSTKISSLFPRRSNRNAKRTEKHKNKMAQGNTYNKSQTVITIKVNAIFSLIRQKTTTTKIKRLLKHHW